MNKTFLVAALAALTLAACKKNEQADQAATQDQAQIEASTTDGPETPSGYVPEGEGAPDLTSEAAAPVDAAPVEDAAPAEAAPADDAAAAEKPGLKESIENVKDAAKDEVAQKAADAAQGAADSVKDAVGK